MFQLQALSDWRDASEGAWGQPNGACEMPLAPGVGVHFTIGVELRGCPSAVTALEVGPNGASSKVEWLRKLRRKRVADVWGLIRVTLGHFGRPIFSQPA